MCRPVPASASAPSERLGRGATPLRCAARRWSRAATSATAAARDFQFGWLRTLKTRQSVRARRSEPGTIYALPRIFLDTEFKNTPWSGFSELLWVGLADEAGDTFSAINADVAIDENASEFTRSVVASRMTPEEPRLARDELSAAIVEFCGNVDEFWAWCPAVEDLVGPPFGLGDGAAQAHRQYWDWDFQLLQTVVAPWPQTWPTSLCDLGVAVRSAGVTPPPNTSAHHPRDDALWNLKVFQMLDR